MLGQPKIQSEVLVIQNVILPEKSVKHVVHVYHVTKPIAEQVISEITPHHVKYDA